ncbi:MAG: hypothetical protein NCW75_15480 [Phycisphaera sp.]|nr:MAG: hypothetical protein NCW75_15480 [Phycisphaera sp.]
MIVQNSRIEVGIVDVRDPSQPVQRESWDGRIYLSALVGDVAYAVDFRTITALDVSDPLNPVEIGSIEAPRQLAYGQAAVSPDGTVGYFPGLEWAVGNGHMLVLDIADPSLMRVVDRINTGRTPIFMRTQDRLVLYAPRGPDEPRVYRWVAYDTSDPLRPEKIGVKFVGFRSDKGFNTHPIEGTPYLLHYSSSGMSILDTSVWPGDPIAQELTDIPLAGPVRGMAKQTARLFVSAEPDQLLAIDAREVARPVVTASLSARAGGLVAEPGRLVLASEDGVTVFDTSHPGFPVRRGTIPLPPGATAVESFDLEGTLVVAALREAGLWTIDISDPDRPVTRSRILTDSDGLGPIAVALIEDQAYVSTRTFDGRHYTLGGWLVNLSEPDSPVVNSVPGVGGTYHFHRVGTRWLWNGGVYLDVSDPRNPQIIGVATHRLGDHRAVPDYAYLHVLGFNQIVTFDTRSPSYVQRKETFWQEELEIGEDAVGVRVGRHLYAAGDGGRLYRINLSDCPSCPADMDADGVLTVFDWLAFQTAFERGLPAADFDGNGRHTLTDYLAFLDAFNAGCP